MRLTAIGRAPADHIATIIDPVNLHTLRSRDANCNDIAVTSEEVVDAGGSHVHANHVTSVIDVARYGPVRSGAVNHKLLSVFQLVAMERMCESSLLRVPACDVAMVANSQRGLPGYTRKIVSSGPQKTDSFGRWQGLFRVPREFVFSKLGFAPIRASIQCTQNEQHDLEVVMKRLADSDAKPG